MKKMHCYLLALTHHHFLRRHSGGATLQTWNSFLCKMLMLWALPKAELSNYWSMHYSKYFYIRKYFMLLNLQVFFPSKASPPACSKSFNWNNQVFKVYHNFNDSNELKQNFRISPVTLYRNLFLPGALFYEK